MSLQTREFHVHYGVTDPLKLRIVNGARQSQLMHNITVYLLTFVI
jgi:hypothetical protein